VLISAVTRGNSRELLPWWRTLGDERLARHAERGKAREPLRERAVVDALRMQLRFDPRVHAHGAHTLHVPGPWAEREAVEHVMHLLVGGLLSAGGLCRRLGARGTRGGEQQHGSADGAAVQRRYRTR